MSDIFIAQIVTQIFPVTDQDGAVVDISSATISIVYVRPNKTTFTKTASLTGDGTDGEMEYTTDSSDLDEEGKWFAQGIVVIAGKEYPTTIVNFAVSKRLG